MDWDRTLGFPPASSKSPRNERHTVKTLMSPNPRHNPQLGLGLGERAKTFPLISFKNSNKLQGYFKSISANFIFETTSCGPFDFAFRSVRLHKEKRIGNECFGFDWTLKIAFQKNLVLVTDFV